MKCEGIKFFSDKQIVCIISDKSLSTKSKYCNFLKKK